MKTPSPSQYWQPQNRAKLAVLVLSPALVLVLVAVVVSLLTLSQLPAEAGETIETGLARIGNDLALVIVTDVDGSIAEIRSSITTWGLRAPAVALVIASALAWWASGVIGRTVQTARAEVDSADTDRANRLQEVVHELRTPLAVMGTNLELAAGESGAQGANRYIDAARRAMDRMARTIDDLDGHGEITVEQEGSPVDLSAVAEAAVAEHVGPGTRRKLRVALRGSGPLVVTGADQAAVRTALGNFLSNALRLAPQGSNILIDWGKHKRWAWLAVSDEGPGLPAPLHARVFERGWQGPHDRDRPSTNGQGLGLTIARQVTEAQGGVVTIDSEEGGGTTLTIWLPLEQDADRRNVVAPDQIHPVVRPWGMATARA